MRGKIQLKTKVHLGVVPTHLRFVGCLVPDENGRLPRDPDGTLGILSGMKSLCELSPVKHTAVQVSLFPGTDPADISELITALKALDLEVLTVMMLAGVNPMDPADEEAVVAQLMPAIKAAIEHGIRHISSTSIEEWMSAGETRRNGADFDAAIAQNVKVHQRAYEEAGLADSCVESWHIEFLRPGEFQTFTDLARGWAFVSAANKALDRKFFKILLDASHCGNSGLSIPQNIDLIKRIAAAGELGIFHASAKTTRGCLSTDDGWVGALLAAAAATGELRYVFAEVFNHEDEGLAALKKVEPGFGIDTRDGRTYTEVMTDILAVLARRLNNLVARGILKN